MLRNVFPPLTTSTFSAWNQDPSSFFNSNSDYSLVYEFCNTPQPFIPKGSEKFMTAVCGLTAVDFLQSILDSSQAKDTPPPSSPESIVSVPSKITAGTAKLIFQKLQEFKKQKTVIDTRPPTKSQLEKALYVSKAESHKQHLNFTKFAKQKNGTTTQHSEPIRNNFKIKR